MASARFPLVREEVVKAERRISRASSSIERPWWAARTRKRVLVFWSSCRMVSVAMPAMIALLASDAKSRAPNSTPSSDVVPRARFGRTSYGRQVRLTPAGLDARLRALKDLAAGKLRPPLPSVEGGE